MSMLGYTNITLPSKGLLYGSEIPDGVVAIRKPNVREEMRIQASSNVINSTISTCCKLPQGFSAGRLLSTDRMAILIALRVYTYGPKYTYSYRCQGCGQPNKAECDLGVDMKTRETSDDLVEPIETTLPDSGKLVKLRFIRGDDEEAISKAAKRLVLSSNDAGDPSTLRRMAHMVVEIDGQDMAGNPVEAIEKFVGDLTAEDGLALRHAVEEKEPGVDITVYPTCRHCGMDNEMPLPFTGDFFRPSRPCR